MTQRLLILLLILALQACSWPKGREPAKATITGEVVYRERMMLPQGSTVTVRLEDVALQDVAATVIAETSFTPSGGPPFAFELQYYPPQILPKGRYALRARIEAGGRLMFINDTHIDAFPEEGGPVEILVRRVSGN